MSWEDTWAKLLHYQRLMMETPIDSPERVTWVEITRLFQEQIKQLTSAATEVSNV